MSDWKNTQARKLYTQSGLKTNTSFQFQQSTTSQFFPGNPTIFKKHLDTQQESLHNSLIYIKEASERNNSSFTLHSGITSSQINEIIQITKTICFLSSQTFQNFQRVKRKQAINREISYKINQTEQVIKKMKEEYQNRYKQMLKKKSRVQNLKKGRVRCLTQQTQQMKDQIKMMKKVIQSNNVGQYLKNSSVLDPQSQQVDRSKLFKRKQKKRIYVPIFYPYQSYQHLNHPYYQPHHQTPAQKYSNNYPSQVSQNQYAVNLNKQPSTYPNTTKKQQPYLLSAIRQGFTKKFDQLQIPENSLDYFDKSINSTPKNKKQVIIEDLNIKQSKNRKANGFIRLQQSDRQQQQCIQMIENSCKYLSQQRKSKDSNHNECSSPTVPYAIPKILETSFHEEDYKTKQRSQYNAKSLKKQNLNNSYVEIYNSHQYSQSKKTDKYSSQKDDSSDKQKRLTIQSEKKSRRRIQQSNIGIDMNTSKNSGSSKSDSSKQPQNRYLPHLNQGFQQIQEQSEQIASLRATPIDKSKLKSSFERQLKLSSSRKAKKDSPKQTKQSQKHLHIQQQQHQDEILNTIKLTTQSIISRNRNSCNLKTSVRNDSYDEDDILGGITLLKISKASRERDLSLKNSLSNFNSVVFDNGKQQTEKGSQSEIFSKEKENPNDFDLQDDLDFSLRGSMQSKVIRNSTKRVRENKGHTEPLVRGQLMAIPSVQLQEQEDSPFNSNQIKKK